jgi:hypothetical protein
MNKSNIDEVIDFCIQYNVPFIGKQLDLYELYYNEMYDKFSNKKVAEKEIFSEWKQVLRAYWDNDLRSNLRLPKVIPIKEERDIDLMYKEILQKFSFKDDRLHSTYLKNDMIEIVKYTYEKYRGKNE